ncbi:hypothetical protein ACWC9R_09910 [Streptomyces sp. NPDC001219]
MATVRAANGRMRNRGSAVPFRVLWLAALLISVLVAHGARAETAEGHLVNALPVATAAAEAGQDSWLAPEHPAHSGQPDAPGQHTDELCVSGQPQQGAAVPPPCPAPSAGTSWDPPVQGRSGASDGARSALPPLRGTASSVVRQV